MNKKIKLLEKAKKVNYAFDKMDKETQEAVKGLINHLMVNFVNQFGYGKKYE